MLSEIHRGRPVTDGDRHGIVIDLQVQSRRGMQGAAISDVMIRWAGGTAEWCDPGDLFDEPTNESGLKT